MIVEHVDRCDRLARDLVVVVIGVVAGIGLGERRRRPPRSTAAAIAWWNLALVMQETAATLSQSGGDERKMRA